MDTKEVNISKYFKSRGSRLLLHLCVRVSKRKEKGKKKSPSNGLDKHYNLGNKGRAKSKTERNTGTIKATKSLKEK